jgi:ribosomal protein S12 methylthiotransferase accessory factor
MTPGLQLTLRKMVDPEYGIANRFIELGVSPYAPDVFVTCADGGPPSYLIDHKSTSWDNCATASGAAYRREEACWAALGELAERYCASVYDRRQLIQCTANALPGPIMSLEDMILFAPEQYDRPGFPYYRYDASALLYWANGYDVVSARAVFAPAQLLYLSHDWAGEALMQTVSTGLACHSQPELARRSAMLELIERDGFAAAWLLGMPLPRLQLSQPQEECLSAPVRRALRGGEMMIRLYVLPNEFGIANIVAVATHEALGFGAFGAAAHVCPFKAIEKAVLESLHSWIGFSQTIEEGTLPARDAIITPHDHARYYMQAETWHELDWFLNGACELTLSNLRAGPAVRSSDEIALRLNMHGYKTYIFDLTTDDVFSLGLRVVRAIIPGLQPLIFGQSPVPEDRRRLQICADYWGWSMPDHLNQTPHPFP